MNKLILKTLKAFLVISILFVSGNSQAQSTKKFKSEDIGNPAVKGGASFVAGGVDITAGGEDIWGNADQFCFVYRPYSGDFDVMVRLEAFEKSHLYAKAGLMAREDRTSGAKHILFVAFPNNDKRNNNRSGYEFQYRPETGKASKAIYPSLTDTVAQKAFPVSYPNGWMRLKRVGMTFSAYTGTDGKTWKQYTQFVQEMPAQILLGMAVTSHAKATPTVAKFREFKIAK